MTLREDGYYWVRNYYDKWEVSRWVTQQITGQQYWERSGWEDRFPDSVFQEINPSRLIPPEQ